MFRILNSITFCFVKHIIKITFLAFFLFFFETVTMKKDSQNTKRGPKIPFKNVLFLFDKNMAYTFF